MDSAPFGRYMFNSVISDLQQVQSRYETAISSACETIKSQAGVIVSLEAKAGALEEVNRALNDEVSEHRNAKDELSRLSLANTVLVSEVANLKRTIIALEEDQRSFMKISHLAALDKENSRLRQELEVALKKNVVSHAVPLVKSVADEKGCEGDEEDEEAEEAEEAEVAEKKDVGTSDGVNDGVGVEGENENENELDVYEKKIDGRIYYVSRGDDRSVYMKNNDDSIGRQVGSLVKIGDKYKMSWVNGVVHHV
jgi:hypothetical protein